MAAILVLHVRPGEWDDPATQRRIRQDLERCGWTIVSIEKPSGLRPDYVVTVELQRHDDMGRPATGPAGDTGRPICPVCFHPIQPGHGVLRADNLFVHVECFDRVTRWDPPTDRTKPT
jgi:hypothetical protein